MITFTLALVTGLGRRAAYYVAVVLAVVGALWIAVRQGRQAGEARYAIRRVEARIRSLQSSKEIRHEVQNMERSDLQRRLARWMRD
ncbi:hypothetical protein [Lentibacter algarum]|uniref:hypothetical protein n=1 Tax=Lentibacter algarum TaxID=576131 RepID=UPI0023536D8E|nr:hypothetical protein [Lentibacter algarum]MCO4829197.1 hypothetical protein [Lentibacter algarum]